MTDRNGKPIDLGTKVKVFHFDMLGNILMNDFTICEVQGNFPLIDSNMWVHPYEDGERVYLSSMFSEELEVVDGEIV